MKGLSRLNKKSNGCADYSVKLLALLIFTILSSHTVFAAEMSIKEKKEPTEAENNVEFDASFLNVSKKDKVDLSRFANGGGVLPGTYRASIYVNGVQISNNDVVIKTRNDKTFFSCLSSDIIKEIRLNQEEVPQGIFKDVSSPGACLDLNKYIPDAQVKFNSNEQQLDITLPQIYINTMARDSVSPELWDSGVPAAILGYNVSGYSSESNGRDYHSMYAGINSGLNIGAWYLRHNGSFNWMENGPKKYTTLNTYIQRDIPRLEGRFLAGQSNTLGLVFDTLPFSGVQLASDERMLPSSMQGYAPSIRGIARTNARVTVRQSEQIIYETTVTPGEFLINDLYPTGYGGDLDVTVLEADGSEQHFKVPYASVAQLLRPGTHRYAATIGTLRSDSLSDNPAIYQATYQRGLTNTVTGYGGLQASQDYYALQMGLALGTSIGAVAADVTQARTHLGPASSDKAMSGQSFQLSYSKAISETNSNLSLAAYRFSTDGYMDFMTAMQTRDAVQQGMSADSVARAKNRITVTAGQGLPGDWGQFYISSSLQNYWNQEGSDKQYQVGYNNRYKKLTYGLSVSRSQSEFGTTQNNYLLSFSFPLGRDDQSNVPQMRIDLNHDNKGRTGQQATVSGTAGRESEYSYGMTAMNTNQGGGTSGSLNGQYRSPVTSMSATYSTGKHYQSSSLGVSGTMVAHSGGLTLTPYSGYTFAIVEAKGAQGAHVSSYPGVRIDSRGYAIVPYLTPYQMNEIYVDPKGTSEDVEMENTSQKVAPYSGAVVSMKYQTKQGTPILINAVLEGQPVPFGANVIDSNGNSVGAVGQGGQIYARVIQSRGQLQVKWGESSTMQCSVNYILIPQEKGKKIRQTQRFNSSCIPFVHP